MATSNLSRSFLSLILQHVVPHILCVLIEFLCLRHQATAVIPSVYEGHRALSSQAAVHKTVATNGTKQLHLVDFGCQDLCPILLASHSAPLSNTKQKNLWELLG